MLTDRGRGAIGCGGSSVNPGHGGEGQTHGDEGLLTPHNKPISCGVREGGQPWKQSLFCWTVKVSHGCKHVGAYVFSHELTEEELRQAKVLARKEICQKCEAKRSWLKGGGA